MTSQPRQTDIEGEIRRLQDEVSRLQDENSRLKALLGSFALRAASALPAQRVPLGPRRAVQDEASPESLTSPGSSPVPSPLAAREPVRRGATELSSEAKVALFRSLFRGREDVYALRWESQDGRSGYRPACANEWDPELCRKPCAGCTNCEYIPLSDSVIRDHLRGRCTLGVYPLLPDETCWFLAADFDKDGWQEDVGAFLDACRQTGVPAAVERSRSGRGGHVWVFFEEAVPAALARSLGSAMLTLAMDARRQMGLDSYDRLFPNQDTLPKGGFGNLIALPLQGGPGRAGDTLFVDAGFRPYPQQWRYLSSLSRAPRHHVERVVTEAARRSQVVGIRMGVTDGNEARDPWALPPSRRTAAETLQGPLPRSVRAVLANLLFVEKDGLTAQLMNRIIRLAAFQNPVFYRAQRMRMPTFGKPRVIGCAEEFPDRIGLPRGSQEDLERFLASLGVALTVRDERLQGAPLHAEFRGALQAEQERAVQGLLPFDIGVLVAPTGFGKTVVAARLIADRGANTIVLVHRKSLLDQWRERLAAFLGLPVGEVGSISGESRKPGGAVDVASLQSLCRKGEVDDLVGRYGHVVVDECHHVPAFTFERVLREAKAKYVLGLTATPVRRDGRHPIIEMQCGPIRVRMRPQDAAEERRLRQVAVLRVTDFELPERAGDWSIQGIYAALANDATRNALILQDVQDAVAQGRRPLVLTERTDHLSRLASELGKTVRHVIVLQGGMARRQRALAHARIDEALADEGRVIVATGRYAGEGFDDVQLDTLFLAMPVSWRGTLQQYVGRLHRARVGKCEVRVYDYVDRRVGVLARMYAKRLRGYRAMGYEVDGQLELL